MILGTVVLLAATLHITPERAVSPPLRNGSPYEQYVASAAATDTVALLAWGEENDRAAVRIDRDGHVLDVQPIALSTGMGNTPPRVARGPGGWMVVWPGMGGGAAIQARFVRDDGSTSDIREFVYGTSASDMSIGFDGTHYLVAWTRPTGSIAAIRLNAAGFPVEGMLEIPAVGWFDDVEVVGFDGGGFAVVAIRRTYADGVTEWTAEQIRLDTGGNVLSVGWLDRTSTGTMQNLHAVADGSTLVATWASAGITGPNTFVAREGEPLRLIAGVQPAGIVELAGEVTIVALNLFDETTLLISEDGTERKTVGTATVGATAASFGDRALVGMAVRRTPEYDLSTAVVDAALQDVVPQTRLEIDPPLQERPAVARNAHGEALAVWVESGRRGGPAVMGTLLDGAGWPRGEAFVLGAVHSRAEVRPRVASDGTDFLVVWYDIGSGSDQHGLRAVHVQRGGTVSAPVRHLLGSSQVCLAWNGTDYLLGHLRLATTAFFQQTEVRVTRLSREGARLGEPVVITPELLGFYDLSCAAGESATLFAFGHATRIEGALVTDGGTIGAPFRIGNIDERSGESVRVAVAANGDTFLAAWTDYAHLQWATVTGEGTASPVNESLELELSPLRSVAAAPHGDGFFLGWHGFGNVLGLALDRNGRTVEGAAISLAPQFDYELALAGGDAVTAVYQRDLGSQLRPRWRVFAKTIGHGAPARRRTVRH